jgi:hypothetical protein
MDDVKVTFIGLRAVLGEIAGAWAPAARASVTELNRLLGSHRDAMEPLFSIAARMNPNLAPTAVFENDAILDLDRMIVGKLEEFAQSRPVSPENTARSSGRKPRVDSPHAKLITFARIGAA